MAHYHIFRVKYRFCRNTFKARCMDNFHSGEYIFESKAVVFAVRHITSSQGVPKDCIIGPVLFLVMVNDFFVDACTERNGTLLNAEKKLKIVYWMTLIPHLILVKSETHISLS